MDFNPRAPCGARRIATISSRVSLIFQSTRPVRGATVLFSRHPMSESFQSTRPVRGATHSRFSSIQWRFISIHAPRAGRDTLDKIGSLHISHFNPRAPCGARLVNQVRDKMNAMHFNPRAPCGARHFRCYTAISKGYDFNPRAPCGARPRYFPFASPLIGISIHAPRAGRDPFQVFVDPVEVYFNPRAPCGARHPRQDR